MMHVQNVTDAYSDPCPLGYRWVCRTATIAYGGDLATEVRFFAADLLILDETLFTQPNGPSYVIFNDYVVIEAGEQFHITSSGQDQGVDVTASGYQLSVS